MKGGLSPPRVACCPVVSHVENFLKESNSREKEQVEHML